MTETERKYMTLLYDAWVEHHDAIRFSPHDVTLQQKHVAKQSHQIWRLFTYTEMQYGLDEDDWN